MSDQTTVTIEPNPFEVPLVLVPDDDDEGPFFESHEATAVVPHLEKLRDSVSADPWLSGLFDRLINLVEG